MEEIQKELRVRARIMGIYNKQRDDFETKQGWDDYLENVEDIIYNLVNRIDIEATETKVAEYKRTNHLSIIANQARQAEAQKQAQQATAAAAVAGPPPETQLGNTAPAFTSVKPQTLIAAQPQPLKMPAVNADGGLIVPRISKDAFMAMATASGWSTELPKSRAVQEALSSMLIF